MARAGHDRRVIAPGQASLGLRLDPAALDELTLREAWRVSGFSLAGISFERVMASPVMAQGLRLFAVARLRG